MSTKPRLGSGGRFKALTRKFRKQGISEEGAKAIAAYIGRRKYGAAKMARLSSEGRRRK